jgi:hypothetical protein
VCRVCVDGVLVVALVSAVALEKEQWSSVVNGTGVR